MKKRILLFAIVFLVLFAQNTEAVSPRGQRTSAELYFKNSIAHCEVKHFAENSRQYIDATVQLWHDGRCIATWYSDGYGSIDFYREAEVTYGETYTLKVTVYINESALEPVSVTATCQ